MAITLYHHPLTRAANIVWALEELGCPYELEYVDLRAGAHKEPKVRDKNPMGKVPLLVDGDAVVTESAAIALYLADRYGAGRLAPGLDAPERGTYLRWSLYAPSVIEPGCYAHAAKWEYKAGSAGWGTYEAMLDTISSAIGEGPWLLGESFTMADVIFGGTVRYMLKFGILDERPEYAAYVARLNERPANQRALAINAELAEQHGLTT